MTIEYYVTQHLKKEHGGGMIMEEEGRNIQKEVEAARRAYLEAHYGSSRGKTTLTTPTTISKDTLQTTTFPRQMLSGY
jgi:hypothetical protein